jgi:hypothetical protein
MAKKCQVAISKPGIKIGTTDSVEKEMEALAQGLVGQLLSGTASTMFMTKTLDGKLNTAEIIAYMSNYFAPTEKANIDTLLREWQDLKFLEESNPIAIWTELERLDMEFRKCDASNAFLNTWDRRASSLRAKMPTQPHQRWQHFKPTADDMADEVAFMTAMRKFYEETALPLLRARPAAAVKPTTLTTVATTVGCAACGRTNHTTENHKSKEEMMSIYERRRNGKRDREEGKDEERHTPADSSTNILRFKGKCHFCLETGHRIGSCPMMAALRHKGKAAMGDTKTDKATTGVHIGDEEIDEMDYLDAMIRENKRCGLSSCMTNIELFFW